MPKGGQIMREIEFEEGVLFCYDASHNSTRIYYWQEEAKQPKLIYTVTHEATRGEVLDMCRAYAKHNIKE